VPVRPSTLPAYGVKPSSQTMTNIYVGNLDFATSADELRSLFAAYGAVNSVTAVTENPETSREIHHVTY